ncbi:MAG: hypothetical protein BEN19_04445 [Epulopiscium sp. Nuni2H_MBin003]|nr:MAG: hypothetical protein BEN19_04445 [Epulopiscium sp. Nuni2H_MBin003]
MNDTKAKIFSVMYNLMAEQGYEKTSTNQICELAGIKKPTLYYYFKNKEDLLIEFIKYYLLGDVNKPTLKNIIKTKEQVIEYTYNMGSTAISFTNSNPLQKQVLAEIRILEKRMPSVKETTALLIKEFRKEFLELIELAKELGAINKKLDTHTICILIETIFEGIDSTILYYSDETSELELIKAWEQFVELLMEK